MKTLRTTWPVAFAMLVLLLSGTLRGEQMPAALAVPANPAPHPAPAQPLPYSHKTHVGMGMQCKVCHTNPDPGNLMTFPATSTCMNCHAAVAIDRPSIKKLAEYAKSNQPIPWVRVYEVPPGVTWTHRAHVAAGVRCETCHGAVGGVAAMSATTAVTSMASCIGCHQARHISTQCVTCHAWPQPTDVASRWNPPTRVAVPAS